MTSSIPAKSKFEEINEFQIIKAVNNLKGLNQIPNAPFYHPV